MTTQRAFTIQASVGRRRRAATQQQILDAAQRLLAGGSPVAALSIDRIATEAGVSRSTFYLHFPDKRELMARLAEREQAGLSGLLGPVFDDPSADRAAIERAVAAVVADWRVHAPVVSGLIELSEYDDDVRDAWIGLVELQAERLGEYLRRRWPDDGSDPETVARIMAWMVERCCHRLLGDPDPEVERRVTAALADVVWRIVGPPA